MTTWNANFEAIPADSDAANQGANKIRELKTAISERLELEMNFMTGTQPLIKAGIASVCYSGTTAQISALSNMSANALAYNTSTRELQRYSGASWANMQLNHATLYNLTSGDPHTQYLKLDKPSQQLSANLDVAENITVDGVDISNHADGKASDEHANGVGVVLGDWSANDTYEKATNYVATTDGFVTVTSSNSVVYGRTGTEANVTRVTGMYGASFPVKKGDTWRIVLLPSTDSCTIFWIPLGS